MTPAMIGDEQDVPPTPSSCPTNENNDQRNNNNEKKQFGIHKVK
jgi:hypothetical protein